MWIGSSCHTTSTQLDKIVKTSVRVVVIVIISIVVVGNIEHRQYYSRGKNEFVEQK